MRGSDVEHAVRLQNVDAVAQIEHGSLDPSGGQLLLSVKATEQSATKADPAEITDQLRRIEQLLSSTH